MKTPAWAQNAVIISDDGQSVRYRIRCPYCGKVDTTGTNGTYIGPGGVSNKHGSCRDCHKSFPVQFGRS